MYGKGIERTVSSGVVFSGRKTCTEELQEAARLNGVLLGLIEEEMELTFRCSNCLEKAGIRLIGQLVKKTDRELLALKNFGRKSLLEIGQRLAELGLATGMTFDFPPWSGRRKDLELINILIFRQPGGGFSLDDRAIEALGVCREKFKKAAVNLQGANTSQKHLLLSTALVIKRLEEAFPEEIPYLGSGFHLHRQWLLRQLKKDSPGEIFDIIEDLRGGK